MTAQVQPYEILLRFQDGALSGAHYVEMTVYKDTDGNVITKKQGMATAIPTDLSETILGKVNAAAITKIAEKDAEIATLKADHEAALKAAQDAHAAAIAAKDSELATLKAEAAAAKAAFEEKLAYQKAMEARVSAVLQSGDPAEYEKLAVEFLTPAQELERQAKIAKIAQLKAEAAKLEEEIGTPPGAMPQIVND